MTGVQTCALRSEDTRLNSSHTIISYAAFCLKKKTTRWRLWAPCRSCPSRVVSPSPAVRRVRDGVLSRRLGVPRDAPARDGQTAFFFNDPAPPDVPPVSLQRLLPI